MKNEEMEKKELPPPFDQEEEEEKSNSDLEEDSEVERGAELTCPSNFSCSQGYPLDD